MADALSGRDGKAGALVEPKSGFGDDAAQTMVSLSGLSVTAATGVQSVWPLQRRIGVARPFVEFVAVPEATRGRHRQLRRGHVFDAAVPVDVCCTIQQSVPPNTAPHRVQGSL